MKTWWQSLLVICFLLVIVVACNEETDSGQATTTPTQQVAVEPQVVAINPPRVWIDRPLTNELVVFGSAPLKIVAHAASLNGSAVLSVRDASGTLLTTVNLGEPVAIERAGGALARYQGEWTPILQESADVNADGWAVYELTVEVGGVVSGPVLLYAIQATPTPSPTLTATVTPSMTATPTETASATSSATPILTSTTFPTATRTMTSIPTASPSNTAPPTATPTSSPSSTKTGTPTPMIVFEDKEPIVCEITPIRGREAVVRLGPGDDRGPIRVLEFGTRYLVTGKHDAAGEIWWQISLQGVAQAWVKDALVSEFGACGLVPPVDAPDVSRPSGPRPTASSATPVPGVTPAPIIHYFYADYDVLPAVVNDTLVYCTNIYWSVEYVDAVYLSDGEVTEGVIGLDSRQICPDVPNGTVLYFTLTIYKAGVIVDSETLAIRFEELTAQ